MRSVALTTISRNVHFFTVAFSLFYVRQEVSDHLVRLISIAGFWTWLVGRSVGWLVSWSVGRSVGWSVGRLVGWSVGWLAGRLLVGWAVGLLVGWLVGWAGTTVVFGA